MKRVCIIGLGLLGGSFGLSLKEKKGKFHIIGVDISSDHATKALELGLVDEIIDFSDGVRSADIVILATPVNTIVGQIGKTLDLLSENAILFDLGSTKELICKTADTHSKRGRFVATHPIAGTENSGPDAAFTELLKNKKIILCDIDRSDEDARKKAEELLTSLGMQLEYMPSVSHDKHIAFVSHLSHISSFALGSAVLETEKNEQNIFIMAGSGFDSTVRLAKSSPDMWTPIFDQNHKNISDSLTLYIEKLKMFKEMIDERDTQSLYEFMKETNDIRRVLDEPKKG